MKLLILFLALSLFLPSLASAEKPYWYPVDLRDADNNLPVVPCEIDQYFSPPTDLTPEELSGEKPVYAQRKSSYYDALLAFQYAGPDGNGLRDSVIEEFERINFSKNAIINTYQHLATRSTFNPRGQK